MISITQIVICVLSFIVDRFGTKDPVLEVSIELCGLDEEIEGRATTMLIVQIVYHVFCLSMFHFNKKTNFQRKFPCCNRVCSANMLGLVLLVITLPIALLSIALPYDFDGCGGTVVLWVCANGFLSILSVLNIFLNEYSISKKKQNSGEFFLKRLHRDEDEMIAEFLESIEFDKKAENRVQKLVQNQGDFMDSFEDLMGE